MPISETPFTKNGYLETPYTTQWHVRGPPYTKNAFSRPHYTTKWHFGYPLSNIFSVPPKPKMAEIRPPIQKMTKLGQNWPIFDPPYKNGQNLTPPIQK